MMTTNDKSEDQGSLKLERYKPGQHPNSKSNLKMIPPGTNIVPGGTDPPNKKGYSLTSRLRDAIAKPLETPSKDAPVGDHIVHAAISGALMHEPTPTNLVWDRIDGKMQDQPAGGNDNRQINIIVKDASVKELVEGIGDRFLGEGQQVNELGGTRSKGQPEIPEEV